MASESQAPGILHSIASDPGPVKRQMEDASVVFAAPAAPGLGGRVIVAAIADGMGGPGGGAEASRTAISTIQRYFTQNPTTNVQLAMQRAMEIAHYSIQQAQSAAPEKAGMKTTLTIAVVADDRLYIGSVGNSRAYLAREGEIQPLTADKTWVQQAIGKRGKLPPPESLSKQPSRYLGEPGSVVPAFRPVEFLWPGDTVLLCTDGVSDFVPEDEIRNVLGSSHPSEATNQLILRALQHGSDDNLTATVFQMPGGTKAAQVRRRQSRSRLSTSAKALILGNLLLLCLIGFLVMRNTGLLNALAAATPTIEVAKPAFILAQTPSAAGPVSTPDTLNSDVLLGTPGAELVTGTPGTPVAAPTLTLEATATPVPTFTPQPTQMAWAIPSSLGLLAPANGFLFEGPDANVILSWNSAGQLPQDVFYVVVIRKFLDGNMLGESHNWTKATQIKLDGSFYTAFAPRGGRPESASASGAGSRSAIPRQDAATSRFEWYVVLERLTRINPDGTLDGVPINSPSETRTFLWGPSAPAPTTPTRPSTPVYGGHSLNDDPFFQAQERRQVASDMVLSPVSTGMAALSLLFSALGLWPRIKSKLRRR